MRFAVASLIAIGAATAVAAQAPMDKGRLGIPLTEVVKPWIGDLDGMAERRLIRVLTTFSKTQYFIDRGTPRGTAYDMGKLLEASLNKTFAEAGDRLDRRSVGQRGVRARIEQLFRQPARPQRALRARGQAARDIDAGARGT